MRFAYADPPYLGMGAKMYGKLHPEAAEWDKIETHAALIERLSVEFDAWAYSLTSGSLRVILPICPEGVRVAAWVKPFAIFRRNVHPAYAWEPVIFQGGRKHGRKDDHTRDWVSANITLHRSEPGARPLAQSVPGAKPVAFCWWVFDLLGAEPDDEFHDLFPGSGAVQRAWEHWKRVHCGFPLLG
jgi:hypothetical protein